MIKKIVYIMLFMAVFVPELFGQGGYYLRRSEGLADTVVNKEQRRFYIPSFFADVRAVGQGNTQIANGKQFNAFQYNPAFLSESADFSGSVKAVFGISPSTLSAISFLNDNVDNFNEGLSLQNLWNGTVEYFESQSNPEAQTESIEKIRKAIQFPGLLLEKIVGDQNNPLVHGANGFFTGEARIGNWGFSFNGYGQSAFQADLGPLFNALMSIKLPADWSDTEAVNKVASELNSLLDYVVDSETGEVNLDVIPAVYSFSYADIVARVGYGFNIHENVSIGANLSFINRRFTASKISAADFSNILVKAFKNFNISTFGAMLDIGALYRDESGLTAGLTVKNLLPTSNLNSSYYFDYLKVQLQNDLENNGDPILNADGDTALVSYHRNFRVQGPILLAVPVITSLGAHYPITDYLDVSFEWNDIFAQSNFLDEFSGRFHLGAEYRISFFEELLGLAFRTGWLNKHMTFGFGLDVYNFIRLDAAYYKDEIFNDGTVAGQLSFHW